MIKQTTKNKLFALQKQYALLAEGNANVLREMAHFSGFSTAQMSTYNG